jgi:hypothetical protein
MDINNNMKESEKILLDSLDGIERAIPNPNLYLKIENNIYSPKNKIITMAELKMFVAAAIILIILNVYFANNYLQNNTNDTKDYEEIISQTPLTSSYKLYEL